MCGIVGFTGHQSAKDVLIEGLKRLEYRGYDSAGIALQNTTNEELTVVHRVGKVAGLAEAVESFLTLLKKPTEVTFAMLLPRHARKL